jgi:hypothetical protein
MSQLIKMAGNGVAGTVQGNFGTYTAASDGSYTIDSRDVPAMLLAGMTYLNQGSFSYYAPIAPAAASATAYIASTTLSNGALTFANQPDVLRQAQLVVTQFASPGPSAGTLALTYYANDGSTQVDTFNLNNANVTSPYTAQTSKGVAHFVTGTVSGLAGTGYFSLGSTATLSVPVPPEFSGDITFLKETINTGDETVGTKSTVTLGSIAPTTAPNATHTYSFFYTTLSADV